MPRRCLEPVQIRKNRGDRAYSWGRGRQVWQPVCKPGTPLVGRIYPLPTSSSSWGRGSFCRIYPKRRGEGEHVFGSRRHGEHPIWNFRRTSLGSFCAEAFSLEAGGSEDVLPRHILGTRRRQASLGGSEDIQGAAPRRAGKAGLKRFRSAGGRADVGQSQCNYRQQRESVRP